MQQYNINFQNKFEVLFFPWTFNYFCVIFEAQFTGLSNFANLNCVTKPISLLRKLYTLQSPKKEDYNIWIRQAYWHIFWGTRLLFLLSYNGRHNGCCPCTCTLCCSRIKVHKKQYSQMLQLHSSLKDCYKYTGCKQQQFFKCFGSYVTMNYELMTTRTKQITKSIARNIDMLTTF